MMMMVAFSRKRSAHFHKTHNAQNKELLYAARAYPSARSVLSSSSGSSGGGGGGDKKKKKEGGAAAGAKGVPVTTAFIFSMSAAANCEVCKRVA